MNTLYTIEFNKTLLHTLPATIAFVGDALLRRYTDNLYLFFPLSLPLF